MTWGRRGAEPGQPIEQRLLEVPGIVFVASEGIGDFGDRPPAKRFEPSEQFFVLVDPHPELAVRQRIEAIVEKIQRGAVAAAFDLRPCRVADDEFPQRALVPE